MWQIQFLCRFPLSDPEMSPNHSTPSVVVPVSDTGTCHAVLMWWSADMNGAELSMSPWKYIQWRDHWLQAVQLLPKPLSVNKGKITCILHVSYSHDYHMTTLQGTSCPSNATMMIIPCGFMSHHTPAISLPPRLPRDLCVHVACTPRGVGPG